MNLALKKLKIFLITVSLTASSLASAETGVKFVLKDEKAPYTGYLFTEPKTVEVRIHLLERDKLKEENESLYKSIKAYEANLSASEAQVNILLKRNDELASSLTSAKDTSFWEKALWFGIGAVAVGLGVYVGNQVTQ